jgi:hypothetical protein
VIEVVGEPDLDAAGRGTGERVADGRRQRVGEPQVVDRDIERVLRRGDESRELSGDVLRRLAAVGERRDLYRAAFVRCSAL